MYVDEYVENDILAQDGVALIRLLYAKALEKIALARRHLAAGRIAERAQAIAHASEVLLELQGALDFERGGEIAKNLAELYEYAQLRLNEANARQLERPLAEAERVLETLHEGWKAIAEPGDELASAEFSETGAESGRAWTL